MTRALVTLIVPRTRSQSRKESEFVVVALRGSPVTMNGGNEHLRFLNGEWIYGWTAVLY